MLFTSIEFLVFFPVVVCVYFLLTNRLRWLHLLVAGYYFYMAWKPAYASLMFVEMLTVCLAALGLDPAWYWQKADSHWTEAAVRLTADEILRMWKLKEVRQPAVLRRADERPMRPVFPRPRSWACVGRAGAV